MQTPEPQPIQSPALSDMLAGHLKRQIESQRAGFDAGHAHSEVIPFEAVPAQPPDPRTAWTESLAVLGYFDPMIDSTQIRVTEDWADLVGRQEPAMALPLAIGNYPQAVRNLTPLLQTDDLSTLQPRITSAATLNSGESNQKSTPFPDVFVAIAVSRTSKQFDRAENQLNAIRSKVPAKWREVFSNEEAALAWHKGEANRAIAIWQSLSETAPVLFNRGMAALFTGRPADARSNLSRAVDQIPDDSGWHHLGKLYLAVAEMRGH